MGASRLEETREMEHALTVLARAYEQHAFAVHTIMNASSAAASGGIAVAASEVRAS